MHKNRFYTQPLFLAMVVLSLLLAQWPVFEPLQAQAGRAEAEPDWTLFWSDEFDGAGSVNAANWQCDSGTGYPGGPANWGTGEVEVMSCSQENVFQSDGVLHIRALHSGSDPASGWTSGRIETQRTDFRAPAGGGLAVEAAIRLPELIGEAAQGYWPAFWMLGAPYRGNYWNWPGVGEIDIMENVNGLNQWWGVFHCGTNPGGPCGEPNGIGGNVSGFSPSLQAAFHTYRLEFDRNLTPEEMRWYVDGTLRLTLRADQVDAATWSQATDHGFFIILNLAMGGGWPGSPSSATVSGGTLLVDHVRVYAWPVHWMYLPLLAQN